MSNTTVAQFAAELNRPVDDLLKQLKEAGSAKTAVMTAQPLTTNN